MNSGCIPKISNEFKIEYKSISDYKTLSNRRFENRFVLPTLEVVSEPERYASELIKLLNRSLLVHDGIDQLL